jgi:hypothetical protein
MKLKFTKDSKLWIPNIGIYEPKQIIEVDDETTIKKMLESGYFKEVKEAKPKEKGAEKP